MQNQTEQEWIDATEPNEAGTGIFILIKTVDFTEANIGKLMDVRSEVYGPIFKMYAKKITYLQCVKIGLDRDNVPAFKWVPDRVASYEKLESEKNEGEHNRLCVGRCKGLGNLCVAGECK